MEKQQAQSTPWYQLLFSSILLTAITWLAYFPSLQYEFQFDDIANISKHYKLRHYSFGDIFFSGTRWISYWLNSLHYKIGKFEPLTYRIGNVITHSINGLLVFFLLFALLCKVGSNGFFRRNAFAISFLTALMFLLHPVQTQTVSYVIQGQLEGISALFSLAMALLFVGITSMKNPALKLAGTLFFFILAFLSTGTKEIAIVAPFLILLIDWFFIAQGSAKKFFQRAWFHALNAIVVIGTYVYLLKPSFFIQLFGLQMEVANNLGNIITPDPEQTIKPLPFFISQFKVILHYLWIFIYPTNICVEYDWKLVESFFALDCIIPFLVLCGIAAIVYNMLKKNTTSVIAFAVLWFAILMAPRSSILPSPELLVDYKTYLASVGWLLILSAGILGLYEYAKGKMHWLASNGDRYGAPQVVVASLALLLSVSTWQRNQVWKSGVDFWANIVKNAPGKARAFNNYGVELSQKLGKYAESIPFFEQAIRMQRDYRDPYNNLAVAYAANHQIDRAIETLQLSLQINPYYPEAYNNIASFLIEKKDYDKAKHALNIAIQLRPHYGKAHFNLGRAHMEQGEAELAWESFRKACMEADLDTEAGFLGFAKCSLHLKKYDEAIFASQKVLECNPNNNDAEFMLANSYFMANRFDEAITTYNQMIEKNPRDGKLWYNLAESYFSNGNTTQALHTFEKLKSSPEVGPNAYLRIAACYEKIGSPQRAQKTLQELLAMKLPTDARQTVQTALDKLNQQYRLS